MATVENEYPEKHEESDRDSGVTGVAQVGQKKKSCDQGGNADQHQECDISSHEQVSVLDAKT